VKATKRRPTTTGGRDATLRHVMGDVALSIGMPLAHAPPNGWRWVALADVARMESGHTPSRRHPEYWRGDIPWISVKDARGSHGGVINDTEEHTNALGIENSSARMLPTNTVCLSRGGTVGYVFRLGRPMATSQGFANWICGPEISPEFLAYLFLREGRALDRFASGTTIQTIYYPDLKAFHVCLPSIPEQRRIVAILDEAFEGIAAAKAAAERNVRNAREAFYCGLDEIIKASQPEGSPCFQPLGQLVSQILDRRGVTPKKLGSDFTDAGYRVISAKNIKGRAVNLEVGESRFVDEATYTRWMATPLFEDDVILTSEAPLGEPAYISTQAEWCLGQRLFGIRTKKNILRGRFLFYALQSSPVRKDLLSRATGATAQGIRQAELVKVAIPTPSLRQQDETTQTLLHLKEATDQLTNTLSNRIAALDELKASLLHQAFTGAL
jgi:type I restriction enzyme S subunit